MWNMCFFVSYAFESAPLKDDRLRYNIVILLYDDETDM